MQIVKPTMKKPNPAKNSGLNYDELWEFYPEFFDKCSCIRGKGEPIVKNTLEYLEDWDSISWKQFAMILTSNSDFKKNNYFGTRYAKINHSEWVYWRENVVVVCGKLDKLPGTDYQIDKLFLETYQTNPLFYEITERNMKFKYDKFGKRYFTN